MKEVPIRSKRIALALIRAGFDFTHLVDDKDNPHYKVFMFEPSEEFYKVLNTLR